MTPTSSLRPLSAIVALVCLQGPALAQTVEKCPQELGTLAVSEPQDYVLSALGRYSLGSPTMMLRMMVQESGCFSVVERGVAMQNLRQERALAADGQLQEGSNIGRGQMQGADFVMTPAVQFSDDSGGVGGTIGGLLGRAGGVLGQLGGLAGGVKFKEAETTLVVADVRSSIQVASAQGSASKMNFSLGGWGWGGLGWASAAGYTKTPEGKLIAASLLDNYNKIVQQVRDKPSLVQTHSQASRNNAAQSLQATDQGAKPALLNAPAKIQQGVSVQKPSALPATLVGAFAGQYGGAEQGIFSVMVGSDGRISGVGQSSANTSFTISGMVNPAGALVMTGSGQAGSAFFNGSIDPKSGALNGTWRQASGSGQGTFQGLKQ